MPPLAVPEAVAVADLDMLSGKRCRFVVHAARPSGSFQTLPWRRENAAAVVRHLRPARRSAPCDRAGCLARKAPSPAAPPRATRTDSRPIAIDRGRPNRPPTHVARRDRLELRPIGRARADPLPKTVDIRGRLSTRRRRGRNRRGRAPSGSMSSTVSGRSSITASSASSASSPRSASACSRPSASSAASGSWPQNELESVAEAHARQTALLAEAAEPAPDHRCRMARQTRGEPRQHAGGARLVIATRRAAGAADGRARLAFLAPSRPSARGVHDLAALLAARAQPSERPTARRHCHRLRRSRLLDDRLRHRQGCYEEALSIAREKADKQLEVERRYSLAYVRAIEHDYDGAIADFRAAEEMFKGIGNELMATWAFESGAMVITDCAVTTPRPSPCREHSRARFTGLGDTFGRRNALSIELRSADASRTRGRGWCADHAGGLSFRITRAT